MKILALGGTLAFLCIGSAFAQPAPDAVERAAVRVATVVAETELIPAARGTVKQPPAGAPVEWSACLSSLPAKEVVAKIAYPIADDFTADELVALARFIDTPEGQKIAQARAGRLAAGQIVFALPEQDATAVRNALPEALARKWSSGAVTQPHVARAMRTVLEERQAYCRNTGGKAASSPPPVAAAAGMPAGVQCSRGKLQLTGQAPEQKTTISVRVWIAADGTADRARVEQSSGVASVDAAAMRAAKATRCRVANGNTLLPFETLQSFIVSPGG